MPWRSTYVCLDCTSSGSTYTPNNNRCISMNPTLHRPIEISLSRADTPSSPATPEALCELRMRYRPQGAWQLYLDVWVPLELQAFLARGDVVAVHIETLEDNGSATCALGYPAAYAVLGVDTKSSGRIEKVPLEFHQFKRVSRIVGVFLCGLGLWGLSLGQGWLGALALLAGTHALSASRRIPTKPFIVGRHQF